MKNHKLSLIAVTVTLLSIPMIAFGTNGSANTDTATPMVTPDIDNGNSSSPVVAPITDGGDSSAPIIAPPTDNGNSSAPVNAPLTTDEGNSSAPVVEAQPVNNPTSPSGNSSSSGSSSSSGGSGSYIYIQPFASNIVTQNSCTPITRHMQINIANPYDQVILAQRYMKNDGFNIAETGIFDTRTEQAVREFQKKYSADILKPWGTTEPTGIIGLTTIKKLNQLSCNTSLSLNTDELSVIARYRQSLNNSATSSVSSPDNGTPQSGPFIGEATSTENIFGTTENSETNTASVVNRSSGLRRIWDFIKNLF